jgi:predicted ester cyclase
MNKFILLLTAILIISKSTMAQNSTSGKSSLHGSANVIVLPSSDSSGLAANVSHEKSPKEVVSAFLGEVRSGFHPDKAALYMADTVLAHQVNSEHPVTVPRTPANYAAHVKDFLTLFGKFEFTITELLADGDRVYARWIQKGKHQARIDHYEATGLPLIEYTSAVYRVENGRIVEYWLQSDRLGFEEQLKKNAALAFGKEEAKKQ